MLASERKWSETPIRFHSRHCLPTRPYGSAVLMMGVYTSILFIILHFWECTMEREEGLEYVAVSAAFPWFVTECGGVSLISPSRTDSHIL